MCTLPGSFACDIVRLCALIKSREVNSVHHQDSRQLVRDVPALTWCEHWAVADVLLLRIRIKCQAWQMEALAAGIDSLIGGGGGVIMSESVRDLVPTSCFRHLLVAIAHFLESKSQDQFPRCFRKRAAFMPIDQSQA